MECTKKSILLGFIFYSALADGLSGQNVNIYTSASVQDPVYKAIIALRRDIEAVSDKKSTIKPLSEISNSGIIILNSERDTLLEPINGWEAHRVYTCFLNGQKHTVLQGADTRGTIYAIYSFSEKVLGVPPLWFFCGWQPEKKENIALTQDLDLTFPSPEVTYRGWFPNDMDLFAPWRRLSPQNNEIWLETALRLKLNTIEWLDTDKYDFFDEFAISPTVKLIHSYGLINTSHHHSPLSCSFEQWNDYWIKIKNMDPPQLLLKNHAEIEAFWRYKISQIVKEKINMLWVLGFRGTGDQPFWATFKDAPRSAKKRAYVIGQMLLRQKELVLEITQNPYEHFRIIFYNEAAELFQKKLLNPPTGPEITWVFAATRRDHYPGKDMQEFRHTNLDVNIGYYMNLQFTSTGSHLAAAEGPWKVEDNFRYVREKIGQPLNLFIVNVGNIREHLLSLSAHATLAWNSSTFNADHFVCDFCKLYFDNTEVAQLYQRYFDAFWSQKKSDLRDFKRQYLFQDLRYQKAMYQLIEHFEHGYNPNPLSDLRSEHMPGRTFNIAPADNLTTNQVDALILGTLSSQLRFRDVATKCDTMYHNLSPVYRPFFNDNLRMRAHFMLSLNEALFNIAQAYTLERTDKNIKPLLSDALAALQRAKQFLHDTAHGPFTHWYKNDKVFGIVPLINMLEDLYQRITFLPDRRSLAPAAKNIL